MTKRQEHWRKTLTISVSPELHQKLKAYTDANATNTSKLVQKLLEAFLKGAAHAG